MIKIFFHKYFYLALFSVVLLLPSCVPVKNLSYFNDIDQLQDPPVNPREPKIIRPFDKLYIEVLSIDPKTISLFGSGGMVGSSSMISLVSYIVDRDGNITYPVAGTINVAGITTSEAGKKIEQVLSQYVPTTAVVVKFIDNNITLLGEVQRQGVFAFSQDKITVYDALALGGGLTRYGNRKKIVMIRQEGDKIMHYKLDLSDSRIADKDFYYVQANDIIVVEPLKSISSSYGNTTISIFFSSISVLLSILLFAGV